MNAVFGISQTGAPWRDLPPSYGDWKILTAVFVVGTPEESGAAIGRTD
ncbi:MAG TPA: hypothetical protein DFL85_15585 [Lentisphaeria bacterium]|nr:hypothetical protein C5Q97_20455 [Victivallales bacterium CCUG 44730]HBP05802.1 hypothetical protein [Lentisphaeria bacterium]HCH86918.1 hypothetical protein [Lentisphaeria bacterium]